MSDADHSSYIAPPCKADLITVHQDDHLIVVDKPAGLLSVPGRDPRNHDSVVSRLQADFPCVRVVHRLDMHTSGLMILALDHKSHVHLNRQFEQRLVHKEYVAVVSGLVHEEQGEVDLPLITDWPNRPLQKVDRENGRAALTRWTVLERNQGAYTTRLALHPITGRTHQLRVHMSVLGHPILGCPFYAPDAVRDAAGRLLLHAHSLRATHPDGGPLILRAPVPF
ncbi:MAG: pseudouridine synthase [Gammaproteobacteria bacterium]